MKNILQFRIQKDLIIKRKPIISAFITHAVPIGYKTENKIFYNVKERLLIY